jgi:hypothetical protein
VSLVEQELLTLPEHLSSPPVFSGVRVTRSLVLCICFVYRCLSFFFWPLCGLFFDLRILITPVVSSNIWPLCGLSFDLRILITLVVSSNLWPLCGLLFDLRILITPCGIFKLLAIVWSVLRFTDSDYTLWFLQTFGPCVVCPSIYGF